MIREVWGPNLEQEMAGIRDIIFDYPYISMARRERQTDRPKFCQDRPLANPRDLAGSGREHTFAYSIYVWHAGAALERSKRRNLSSEYGIACNLTAFNCSRAEVCNSSLQSSQ